MERFFDSDKVNAFSRQISSLLDEMNAFKSAHPQLWKPFYDDMIDELENISDTIEDNVIDANKSFQSLPISKFETFQAYVFNNDTAALSTIKGTNERTKTLRAKRKNNKCPVCGSPLTLSGHQNTVP